MSAATAGARSPAPAVTSPAPWRVWTALGIVYVVWGSTYLVLIGSLIAYTAYAWLLRDVAVSKVGTYADVNPAIAIALGWLILDETITAVTLTGAGIIIASVALVVRSESVPREGRA